MTTSVDRKVVSLFTITFFSKDVLGHILSNKNIFNGILTSRIGTIILFMVQVGIN